MCGLVYGLAAFSPAPAQAMQNLPRLLICVSASAAFTMFTAFAVEAPPVELPPGFTAEIVAAAPLVRHPIMATLDDRGRLFVGDSSGVNMTKAELEKALPHRVLVLEDSDGDGRYDKSTVFADRLTFPQGGAWLGGSLYVASPPGIWRFTDTDGDGKADRREQIVSGFDYTGNAADVHGPFVHPGGRLFWCHGRKGHEARDRDGNLVRKGRASGIWSCRPDGTDLRMHAGGGMDNPVEIDFTPEGEIVGTVNIFHGQPRGDCIVHWLRGGAYPREDQGDAIAELKRTGDLLPPVFNFGHVAVSGCAFYRSGALNPEWRGSLFVTHFNTQRVTRMEIGRSGSTFTAASREFLKIRDADVHLTDVLEDRDGSLLVVNTGGWFRSGCPSSLVAKPDMTGAIYRIKAAAPVAKCEPWDGPRTREVWRLAREGDGAALVKALADPDAAVVHSAANALAYLAKPEAADALSDALAHRDAGVRLAAAHALGAMPELPERAADALLKLLEGEPDRMLEHQAMDALMRGGRPEKFMAALRDGSKPALQRRALILLDQSERPLLAIGDVLRLLDSPDALLAAAAADVLSRRSEWTAPLAAHLAAWLKAGAPSAARLALLEQAARPRLVDAAMHGVATALLESSGADARRTAWRLLAASDGIQPPAAWTAALKSAFSSAEPGDLAVVLDAASRLRTGEFDALMASLSSDEKRALPLRLKALGTLLKKGGAVSDGSFELLIRVLSGDGSVSARIEAARILGGAKLSAAQLLRLAPATAALGPVDLREVLKAFRRTKEVQAATALANALAGAVSLGSLQESEVRTLFSGQPPEVFGLVAPALARLAAEDDARRRLLDSLPALVAAKGRADEGRKAFESGKGTCIACHRAGDAGNRIGPELSTIGRIRTARDLVEAVLFPNATMVREFEPYVIETAGGDSWLGVLRRQSPDAVVLADAAGQEHSIPRAQITSMHPLPTSLMPAGLERTVSEQELLDLLAYLLSRK